MLGKDVTMGSGIEFSWSGFRSFVEKTWSDTTLTLHSMSSACSDSRVVEKLECPLATAWFSELA